MRVGEAPAVAVVGDTAYATYAVSTVAVPPGRAGRRVLVVMRPAWRPPVTVPIGVDPDRSPSDP
ncbi:hypothetical protein GCM10009858_05530 [Terrabacter carboxydivorans]|uniref:Uncharacterized protein n=1 Tax=Terrabacter carboxydivorans TaxID=619730 RepID=A0ABN3KST2_9MICO